MWKRSLAALVLLVSSTALADQALQDNVDGAGFDIFGVGEFQANNLAGSGTRCAAVDSTGNIIPMSVACGTGTVTGVTGANGVSCTGSTSVTCTIATASCASNEFVSAASSSSGLACTQPSFANLSGSAACSQLPLDGVSLVCGGGFASVGTVQASNVACGPNDLAWFNGSSVETCGPAETFAESAAPGAPAAAMLTCWGDATGEDWTCKSHAGVVTHGVQTQAGATNNFVTSISAAGVVSIAQPSFTNLASTMLLSQEPTIAAHTIIANGTGLSAQAAQTSIGTTLAFDGTSQLQCIGLRDGGGVNHLTTGTWGLSSVLGTDVSGNVASEAQILCGQSEGPWTGDARKSAGSCAIANVAVTETSGPTSLTIGAIPDSAPASTVLIRPAGSPTVVGVNAVTLVSAAVTKLHYSLQASLTPGTTLCGLFEGGNGIGAGCTIVEYPNDFVAGHIQVRGYIASNFVTAGTLTFTATRNGAGIGGTSYNITSASTPGVTVGLNAATGSSSAADTYGLVFTTSAGYTGGFQTVTVEVLLTQ